jgi:hypothetical protein
MRRGFGTSVGLVGSRLEAINLRPFFKQCYEFDLVQLVALRMHASKFGVCS